MKCCIFRVFCFFYIILILVFESGSSEICSTAFGVTNSGEALPICSASSRTGHEILIDTSLVPHNAAVDCNCSVEIEASAQYVRILYKTVQVWGNTTSCGLRLNAADRVFQCQYVNVDFGDRTFFLLEFSKTTVLSDDACFVLTIGSYDAVKRNATVTCFENGGPTTTPMQMITTSDQNTNKNLHIISSITTSSSATTASGLTFMPTSANETATKTDNSVADKNAQTEVPEKTSNTVVIAAAAGGGGTCLLMVSVFLVYCYCRRINKKTSNKPDYVNTTDTTLETEVTENVMYDIELPEEKKGPNIQLNDLDVTYNTIGDDTYHAGDDTIGIQEKYALSSIKDKSLDNDAGIYTTVEDDKDVGTQENIYQNAKVDTDPAYNNLELTGNIIAEGKNSSITQNNDKDITYSVVNKNRCKESSMSSGYQRPKQLEVANSGDT